MSNTTGSGDTAVGFSVLSGNTTGKQNTAVGLGALSNNTTGFQNIALGGPAGASVTTANNVICIGSTGLNISSSCFIGNIRGVTTAQNDATDGNRLGPATWHPHSPPVQKRHQTDEWQ